MKESFSSYIDAIYKIHLEENSMVTTSDLAEYMGVSDASASEMLRKLSAKGYVTLRPYRGSYLTRKGLNEAMEIARDFRMVSLFYEDVLKIKNPGLAADYSAYALPKEVIQGIARYVKKSPALLGKFEKFRSEKMGKVLLASKLKPGTECKLLFYFGPHKHQKVFRKRDIWPFDAIKMVSRGPSACRFGHAGKKFEIPTALLTRFYVLL